jgi:hypothetical protein
MSTAFDIARLSAICMDDSRFSKIVGTKSYVVSRQPEKNGNKRTYRWENTHRLVG